MTALADGAPSLCSCLHPGQPVRHRRRAKPRIRGDSRGGTPVAYPGTVPATPRQRLLIVDDEPEIRAVLGDYLAGLGYEIEEAATAVAALAAIRERRPHAVILDLAMPGAIGGQDIIASVGATVPVVVITALTDAALARRTLREGAFDFVTKPFDLRRLADVVAAAVVYGARPDG